MTVGDWCTVSLARFACRTHAYYLWVKCAFGASDAGSTDPPLRLAVCMVADWVRNTHCFTSLGLRCRRNGMVELYVSCITLACGFTCMMVFFYRAPMPLLGSIKSVSSQGPHLTGWSEARQNSDPYAKLDSLVICHFLQDLFGHDYRCWWRYPPS